MNVNTFFGNAVFSLIQYAKPKYQITSNGKMLLFNTVALNLHKFAAVNYFRFTNLQMNTYKPTNHMSRNFQ